MYAVIVLQKLEEGVKSPGAGVPSGCEPQDVGAGKRMGSSATIASAVRCWAVSATSLVFK